MSANINGKMVSVADARRKVAYARAQGWLPPGYSSRSRRETNEVEVPKELFQAILRLIDGPRPRPAPA
jgi:hypothetical protein